MVVACRALDQLQPCVCCADVHCSSMAVARGTGMQRSAVHLLRTCPAESDLSNGLSSTLSRHPYRGNEHPHGAPSGLVSIHGLHCCRIFNTHLLYEPVQAACRSVKPMAWAQRCHCCYLGQAAPHGEGDTKPLPWRDFGVPGFLRPRVFVTCCCAKLSGWLWQNFSRHMLLCKLYAAFKRLS